jgi:probable HAF family extracellular repeat protein
MYHVITTNGEMFLVACIVQAAFDNPITHIEERLERMKKVTALAIVGIAIIMAFLSIGQVFGQVSTRRTLTPAQITARQAQEAQAIALIMPPAAIPPSPATLNRIKARKATLALGSTDNSGGGASPMTPGPIPLTPQTPVGQNYAVIDLGAVVGSSSTATAINNNNQVVGYVTGEDAFLYQNGLTQDLGRLLPL